MKRLTHTIEIAASPDEVWATLLDLEGWAQWNILEARAPDGVAVGRGLRLGIRLGRMRLRARATLTEVEPGASLRWRGGIPGLFHADHGFSIDETPDGCRVTHDEEFRGVLVWVALRALGPDPVSRYRAVNEGLKQVVEARSERV